MRSGLRLRLPEVTSVVRYHRNFTGMAVSVIVRGSLTPHTVPTEIPE